MKEIKIISSNNVSEIVRRMKEIQNSFKINHIGFRLYALKFNGEEIFRGNLYECRQNARHCMIDLFNASKESKKFGIALDFSGRKKPVEMVKAAAGEALNLFRKNHSEQLTLLKI